MASKIYRGILTVALDCFARKGYWACSTKALAQAADVSESSLFRVCESKEKLFQLAFEEALSQIMTVKVFRNRLMTTRDFPEAMLFATSGLRTSLSQSVIRFLAYAILDGSFDVEAVLKKLFGTYRAAIVERMLVEYPSDFGGAIKARVLAHGLLAELVQLRFQTFCFRVIPADSEREFAATVEAWLGGLPKRSRRNRSKRS